MTIYTKQDIMTLEQAAIETIPAFDLMQRAGQAAFDVLRQRWPSVKKITVMAGTGNNAGDGFIVASLAVLAGIHVQCLKVGDDLHVSPELQQAMQGAITAGVEVHTYELGSVIEGDVIVDALLGTGFRGPLKKQMAEAIDAINAIQRPVLSLDVPSGLDPDTGFIEERAVRAALTISFIGVKRGLVTGDGTSASGEIIVNDLQIPSTVFDHVSAKHACIPASSLPRRPMNCHKTQFGHVLIVGGNIGFAGAVEMAALAAMRTGAGLVSVATHPEHAVMMDVMLPEVMCHGIRRASQLDDLMDKANVIVVGPGLGQDSWAKSLFKKVFSTEKKLVIDADALFFLGSADKKEDRWVLTPHPGEAARLLKETSLNIQRDRYAAVEAIQKQYGGVCVLKGAGTLVRGSRNVTHICRDGNPGMASAGMGDILTGVIAALIAQGLNLESAAMMGVRAHAQAADLAAQKGERGLMATDLLEPLRKIIND